jgi:hypothetical protein
MEKAPACGFFLGQAADEGWRDRGNPSFLHLCLNPGGSWILELLSRLYACMRV